MSFLRRQESRNAYLPETYYDYAHNHLYSPVALMEDDGDVVERYEYDVYGKPTIYNDDFTQTYDTSQHDNPVMFTGQRLDTFDSDDLQLMYYKNRFYYAETGRFLQRDLMIYYDGMNLYEYVTSSPVLYYDPFGMFGAGIHSDRVWALALLAGIACPAAIAKGANAPDTDFWSRPGETGVKDLAALRAIPFIGEYLYRKKLKAMRKWHFPVSDNGIVEPGRGAAYAEINKVFNNGKDKCNLDTFSRGLHVLQDSWSHQGKPYISGIGHWRGARWVEDEEQLSGGYWEITNGTWRAATSGSADNVKLWPATTRAALLATYDALLRFKKLCKCACPGGKTSSGPAMKRIDIEELLNDTYPGGDVFENNTDPRD